MRAPAPAVLAALLALPPGAGAASPQAKKKASKAPPDSTSLIRPAGASRAKPKRMTQGARPAALKAKSKAPLKPSLALPPAPPRPARTALPPIAGGERTPLQPVSAQAETAFGLILSAHGGSHTAEHVLFRSDAYTLGLQRGDILLSLNDADAPPETVGIPAATTRESRFWAVVRRGSDIVALEEELPGLEPVGPRRREGMTPHEAALARRRAEEARRKAPEAARSLPAPHVRIRERQALWLRFPKGIPLGLREGDVLEGESVTPVASDESLDFLTLPPLSTVWLKVVGVRQTNTATALRLHLFKLRPRGGHVYPVSGRLMDAAGDRLLTRVSRGGTLVTAAPPQASPPALLGGEMQYRAELLAPLALFEGPEFYPAGVGAWLKSAPGGFEVTKVVPGRAAELAAVQAGDLVTFVEGVSAARLDFASAIGRLYGPPGSLASIRVRRKGSHKGKGRLDGLDKEESLSLARGMRYEAGLGFKTRAQDGALEVVEVASDSDAGRSGLKAGDVIAGIGASAIKDISADRLQKLMSGDLAKDNALRVRRHGDREPLRISIKRGWVGTPIAPPYRP